MRLRRPAALVLAAALAAAAAPGAAMAQADPDTAGAAAVAGTEPDGGPTPPARGPRIPGTTLRLGDSLAIVRGRPELRAAPDPSLASGELAYAGTMRFYGAPGDARLVFHDGQLSRATFVLKHASARTRSYVEDDLRRLGYRADCRRVSPNDRDCEWTGPLSASVRADTARLTADFGAVGAERAAFASSGPAVRAARRGLDAVLASDTTAILPDTLDIREDNPNGYPKPVLVRTAFARIPDEIRSSVERGLITLIAFVGADGQVQYVAALDGPEELRPIAEDAVMQYRFQRYQTKEGRWRFWIRLTVYPA